MPTELTVATIGAGAVILAALISFMVAVTSAVIAKEQKVSEFRQDWINSLRKEISELIALKSSILIEVHKIANFESHEKPEMEAISKAIFLQLELQVKLSAISTLITLRLNKDEHKELIICLAALSNLNTKSEAYMEEQVALLEKIRNLTHEVLKSEWERVKKGELLYRFFTTSVKILIGALLAAILVLVLSASFPQYSPMIG